MHIINALDITTLVNQSGRCARSFPLVSLEELFVMHGLEDGSFGIFKVTFADEEVEVFFDYPTDFSEEQAEHLARKVLQSTRFYTGNTAA
jgi:hypothetical protein